MKKVKFVHRKDNDTYRTKDYNNRMNQRNEILVKSYLSNIMVTIVFHLICKF